jgi:hypothetical protein
LYIFRESADNTKRFGISIYKRETSVTIAHWFSTDVLSRAISINYTESEWNVMCKQSNYFFLTFDSYNKIVSTYHNGVNNHRNTTDGSNNETVNLTYGQNEVSTTKYFQTLDDVIAVFTAIDPTKPLAGLEIREQFPLNYQENGGDYAEIHLSVQDQCGIGGEVLIGTSKLTDSGAIFKASDIGKYIHISQPVAIAGIYKITDVDLDGSGLFKDSDTITLNTTWAGSYTDVVWKQLNTLYGDSGFANGLITLEIANSGGLPFLLGGCWYEIDFPTYLTIPWDRSPDYIYIGSDIFGTNQANAVIDEMRILDEVSVDTGLGELLPSSGRSITTDALAVSEFDATPQTLGLFHFNDSLENSANFYTTFAKAFRQSENSVNSNFGQSGVFNIKKAYRVDNRAVFNNNQGTFEFWVSPILDTYNDPTKRYYLDLSSEQQLTISAISNLTILLPNRVKSISSVKIVNDTLDIDYFIGGSLDDNGQVITLGKPLPSNRHNVIITFVPITSQGDRVSIFKDEVGNLNFFIKASGVDYEITVPIYWKKNTWHRVVAGWDLNNVDNQDRMIFMVDGSEAGVIRYGTGLLYGSGILYGQPSVWGSGISGTVASRNILSDINLVDIFNEVNVGADFTEQYPAMARMDNIRFSKELRDISYFGEINGEMVDQGPSRLVGKDLLYSSNLNTVYPVISDALTSLLINFDTEQTLNDNLITVRNSITGIFDFYVEVIDTFDLLDTDLKKDLLELLIQKLKPAHTRAFVSFTK